MRRGWLTSSRLFLERRSRLVRVLTPSRATRALSSTPRAPARRCSRSPSRRPRRTPRSRSRPPSRQRSPKPCQHLRVSNKNRLDRCLFLQLRCSLRQLMRQRHPQLHPRHSTRQSSSHHLLRRSPQPIKPRPRWLQSRRWSIRPHHHRFRLLPLWTEQSLRTRRRHQKGTKSYSLGLDELSNWMTCCVSTRGEPAMDAATAQVTEMIGLL